MKFLGLNLLLITLTFGLAQTQTDITINFPFYLYAYNNLSSVTFDFTTNTTGTVGQANDLNGNTVTTATLDNFSTCLNASVASLTGETFNASTDQGPNATFGSSNAHTANCYFHPTDVTENTGFFSVNPGSLEDGDGWLLVVTNSNSWDVTATMQNLSTDFATDFPGSDLSITPDQGTTDVKVYTGGASAGAVSLADQTDFYRTQFRRNYVLPLQYVLNLDPMDGGLITPANASGSSVNADGEIIDATDGNTGTADVIYTFALP